MMESTMELSPQILQAVKIVLKYEIRALLQRLADTGEESVVLMVNTEDGELEQLGSDTGEKFFTAISQDLDTVQKQFQSFCTSGESTRDSKQRRKYPSPTLSPVKTVTSVVDLCDREANIKQEPVSLEKDSGTQWLESGRNKGTQLKQMNTSQLQCFSSRTGLLSVDAHTEIQSRDEQVVHGETPYQCNLSPTPTFKSSEDQSCSGGGLSQRFKRSKKKMFVVSNRDTGRELSPEHDFQSETKDKTFDMSQIDGGNLDSAESSPIAYDVKSKMMESDLHFHGTSQTGQRESVGHLGTSSAVFPDMGGYSRVPHHATEQSTGTSGTQYSSVEEPGTSFNRTEQFHTSLSGFDVDNFQYSPDSEAIKSTFIEIGQGAKCLICNKILHNKHNRTFHWRSHMGDKRYKCDICGKAFTHPSNMRSHRRVHTGEKPFPCMFCDKKYGRRDQLQAHVEKFHLAPLPLQDDR